ncbi:hypothetical protein ACROYT_G005938 [Oculina patagonica]
MSKPLTDKGIIALISPLKLQRCSQKQDESVFLVASFTHLGRRYRRAVLRDLQNKCVISQTRSHNVTCFKK